VDRLERLPAARLADCLRGPSFRSGRECLPPDPEGPHALLFRMRSFFGRNARAEVFVWLLLAEGRPGHPPRIAGDTGWDVRTVRIVLGEMADSRLVRVSSDERGGNATSWVWMVVKWDMVFLGSWLLVVRFRVASLAAAAVLLGRGEKASFGA
jgi:hypothetical protein